jgi:hypothetical protein
MDFVDTPVAMIAMADAWAAKKKAGDVQSAELKRKAPTGWTEGTDSKSRGDF